MEVGNHMESDRERYGKVGKIYHDRECSILSNARGIVGLSAAGCPIAGYLPSKLLNKLLNDLLSDLFIDLLSDLHSDLRHLPSHHRYGRLRPYSS